MDLLTGFKDAAAEKKIREVVQKFESVIDGMLGAAVAAPP